MALLPAPRFDRLRKMTIYARFAIAEVWLVDLPEGAIERRRRSEASAYGEVEILRAGTQIAPTFAPDTSILVDELLP